MSIVKDSLNDVKNKIRVQSMSGLHKKSRDYATPQIKTILLGHERFICTSQTEPVNREEEEDLGL